MSSIAAFQSAVFGSQLQGLILDLDLYCPCNQENEHLGSSITSGTPDVSKFYKVTAGTVGGYGVGEYFTSAGSESISGGAAVKQVSMGDLSGNDDHLEVYEGSWANGLNGESNGSIDFDNKGYLLRSSGFGTGSKTFIVHAYVDTWYSSITPIYRLIDDAPGVVWWIFNADPDPGDDTLSFTSDNGTSSITGDASDFALGNWSGYWATRPAGGDNASIGYDLNTIATDDSGTPAVGGGAKFGGYSLVDNRRNIDGKLCHIAAWSRTLSKTEILLARQIMSSGILSHYLS